MGAATTPLTPGIWSHGFTHESFGDREGDGDLVRLRAPPWAGARPCDSLSRKPLRRVRATPPLTLGRGARRRLVLH